MTPCLPTRWVQCTFLLLTAPHRGLTRRSGPPLLKPGLVALAHAFGAVSAGAVTSTFAETSTFPVMYSKRSLRSMSDTRSNFAFSAAAMYCGWASFGFSACARAKNQIASTVRYPFPIFAL